MYTYIHIYLHTYVQTYIYTYTNTYIQTYDQQGDQTVDHLIYDCNMLEAQRRILRTKVTKNGQWPADKNELITKHLEPFLTYIESIDFDRL